MKTIVTEILINASPKKIWGVFTNFKEYSTWNPFIQSIKNEVAVKGTIIITLTPPDSKPMIFKPKVLELIPNSKLRWLGRVLFPGLFDGEHIFELIDNKDGTSTFIQREIFKGILVPLFSKMLDNKTRKGFVLMNEALKRKCELA